MNKSKSNLEISSSFSFTKSQPTDFNNGPSYRATKLWERVTGIFWTLPIQRKRGLIFRREEGTFSGGEALTWFHMKLQEEFDPSVTKQQTKLLLQKFLNAGVFVSVDDKKNHKIFKEHHLFRMVLTGEVEETVAEKAQFTVEINPLSTNQIESIWNHAFIQCLSSLMDVETLPTTNVLKNMTSKVNAPRWLESSMSCLTTWPLNKNEFHYENFETDVYKLILDYFKSYVKKHGILLSEFDIYFTEALKLNQVKFPRSASTDELILDMFTPKRSQSRRYRSRSVMSTPKIPPMNLFDKKRYDAGVYYETAFYEKSPITRVVSTGELISISNIRPTCHLFAYENPNLSLSPGDLINHPRHEKVRQSLRRSMSLGGGSLLGEINYENNDEEDFQEASEKTLDIFRLLSLLLDPEKRENLKLLTNFMAKVGANNSVALHPHFSNYKILTRDMSELVSSSKEVSRFLVSHKGEVLGTSGGAFDKLRNNANSIINQNQIKKVPVGETLDKENVNNYCSKISMDVYEDQRLLGETAKSLRQLLDLISMTQDDKDRKRRLKQFEREYPHIYREKYGYSPQQKKRTPFGVLI